MNQIRVYVMKKGFVWLGWIVIKREPVSILYCDNNPTIELEPEINMEYVKVSLSKKRCFKAVKRRALKIAGEV